MILLRSSAQHVYWLGRYLYRIQYVTNQLPFTDERQAADFAYALCLRIDSADNLNQFMLDKQQPFSLLNQLEIARDNIHELRGLLSAQAYAELNFLIKNVEANALDIQRIVNRCCELLTAEQENISLFFRIGQCIEQIDTYFRFYQNIHKVMGVTELTIHQLFDLGWDELQPSWEIFKSEPYINQFYAFTYRLENQFEVYA